MAKVEVEVEEERGDRPSVKYQRQEGCLRGSHGTVVRGVEPSIYKENYERSMEMRRARMWLPFSPTCPVTREMCTVEWGAVNILLGRKLCEDLLFLEMRNTFLRSMPSVFWAALIVKTSRSLLEPSEAHGCSFSRFAFGVACSELTPFTVRSLLIAHPLCVAT